MTAKGTDSNFSDPNRPTILKMHAALTPAAATPWEFGMAGLNQVEIQGAGTFGMIDSDGKTNTVVATNGSITKN